MKKPEKRANLNGQLSSTFGHGPSLAESTEFLQSQKELKMVIKVLLVFGLLISRRDLSGSGAGFDGGKAVRG
jgi:hypothetical protein